MNDDTNPKDIETVSECMATAIEQFFRYADSGRHPYLTAYAHTFAGHKLLDAVTAYRDIRPKPEQLELEVTR